ncbi:MAG TPA: cytochrome c [Byssovorax sp.]|jgi:hypothetical protein
MTSRRPRSWSLSALAVIAATSCVPRRDYTPRQIDGARSLAEVMDVQATVADRGIEKAGKVAYTDAEWAELADTGARIQLTSRKAKAFSRGADYDALCERLHASAEKLAAAAPIKRVDAASAALGEMKATCKECHARFK